MTPEKNEVMPKSEKAKIVVDSLSEQGLSALSELVNKAIHPSAESGGGYFFDHSTASIISLYQESCTDMDLTILRDVRKKMMESLSSFVGLELKSSSKDDIRKTLSESGINLDYLVRRIQQE